MVTKKNLKFEPVEMVDELAPKTVVEDERTGADEYETIVKTDIADVENPAFDEKVALLTFYEEPVTITIHTTHDPNAEQIFQVGVNGKQKIFERGKTYTVERKFVEGLLRARPTHYSNEEYRRDDGSQAVRNPSRSGLRYGFQVVRDDNPLGAQWLMSIAAQP